MEVFWNQNEKKSKSNVVTSNGVSNTCPSKFHMKETGRYNHAKITANPHMTPTLILILNIKYYQKKYVSRLNII